MVQCLKNIFHQIFTKLKKIENYLENVKCLSLFSVVFNNFCFSIQKLFKNCCFVCLCVQKVKNALVRATGIRDQAQSDFDKIDHKLINIDEIWTPKVKEFIRQIDKNFKELLNNSRQKGSNFQGNIKLIDNPEKNYEKYALGVDVKIT